MLMAMGSLRLGASTCTIFRQRRSMPPAGRWACSLQTDGDLQKRWGPVGPGMWERRAIQYGGYEGAGGGWAGAASAGGWGAQGRQYEMGV